MSNMYQLNSIRASLLHLPIYARWPWKPPLKKEDGQFEEPSSVDPITHVGGLKMHRDDQTYKSMIAWIQDYANVVGDRYTSVAELPSDNWRSTQRFVRLTSVPESWVEGTPVQLFVHLWSSERDAWGAEPVAFTQGTVTPQRAVNGSLFLFLKSVAGDESAVAEESAAPPAGRCLVKAYVDSRGLLADDPTRLLGESEYWGAAVIENARWREGFQRAEAVAGQSLERGTAGE
ncbi:MAG: hypothetical protein AB7U20_14475 [Planctomycetaceae bacterium]